MDIQAEYVNFYNNEVKMGALWAVNIEMVGEMGVDYKFIDKFLERYDIAQGYKSSNIEYSTINGAGIILIPGHAFNITGMASPFEYYTYDAQMGVAGRMSITDSRIIGIYSRQEFATHLSN